MAEVCIGLAFWRCVTLGVLMVRRSAMYTVDEWHDFYVMVGGAAAVLTGLIFVVISIHLRQVIATPLFRARARYLTAGLMLSLLTSGLVLVPRQSVTVLGVELIALGLALTGHVPGTGSAHGAPTGVGSIGRRTPWSITRRAIRRRSCG